MLSTVGGNSTARLACWFDAWFCGEEESHECSALVESFEVAGQGRHRLDVGVDIVS